MGRISPKFLGCVAAAAWLLTQGASALACHLSLAGPIIQKPLIYNPFQAGAATADVSIPIRNEGVKPCSSAFAFFRAGALQARAEGGPALAYRVLGPSGPAAYGAASPPVLSPSGGAPAQVTIGAKESVTAHVTISVDGGQVVGPGFYTDQLTLGVYRHESEAGFVRAAVAPFTVVLSVNAQMTLAVAGGGRKTTLNFGDFVEGAVRSVQLLAYSNLCFHLVARSDNAGAMTPVDSATPSDGRWRVPYVVAFNRAAPIDLTQPRKIALRQRATMNTGLAIPVDVQVGSTKGQRAGFYRDVITVAIEPGF